MSLQPVRLHTLSLVPVLIEALNDLRAKVGSATAFFVSRGSKSFLITNWHIVTGRHPRDHKPGVFNGAIPHWFIVHLPRNTSSDSGVVLRAIKPIVVPLYENDTPTWYEYPALREQCDVVAISLDGVEETGALSATHSAHKLIELDLTPGLDVFVLGYPLGRTGKSSTPIWKRGTIATEPAFDQDDLPMFLIDTATREGMSGAPVYAQEVGILSSSDTPEGRNRMFGKGMMFVGVYSGRIHADDPFQAQLGKVWKPRVIDEVIEGELVGQDSRKLIQKSELNDGNS